ncbi:hypothetical protein TWF730_001693 [Orbilia blumenaviensis]|uniref:Uncharacterized protein n=1 Tax=Orbilia blumenaviensis TaxID=1796055 RepID=A0AAV9UIE8_9PEZI
MGLNGLAQIGAGGGAGGGKGEKITGSGADGSVSSESSRIKKMTKTSLSESKPGNWSSAWWKNRAAQTSSTLSRLGTNSPAPLNGGAVRDVGGKLCGIDLHGGFDIPPLNNGDRTVCKVPAGVSSTGSNVRPLSFERPPSAMSLRSVDKSASYRLDSIRTFSPISTHLEKQQPLDSSDKSSIYSVSTSHEAQEPIFYPAKLPLPTLKLDTSICTFYPQDYSPQGISSNFPSTPTVERSFMWDKETTVQKGVLSGIDRYGNSIYRTTSPETITYDHESTHSSVTTKRNSMSTSRTLHTITNPSTPGSLFFDEKLLRVHPPPPPAVPPAPTMMEIRSQLLQGLPGDDSLSIMTGLTTRQQLEEDIMSCLDGETNFQYPSRRESIRQIKYDGENGDTFDSLANNNDNDERPTKDNMIESWRSGVTALDEQLQTPPRNFSRRRSSDDAASNVGSAVIGALEPQHTGLKRLGNSRRRHDRRTGYEFGEAGMSTRSDKEEEEIKTLKAEVEAARSKTLFFQTTLQRTSQRFVNAQNQNEELQRQIADLRDHQKLLYDALAASNEREASPTNNTQDMEPGNSETLKAQGVTEATYGDNIDNIVEENNRLQAQVKTLARELAAREEEVRILSEEMSKQRAIIKGIERAGLGSRAVERPSRRVNLTDKTANRMGAKMKWWRRFILG